jgi:hypothetical protein
VDEPERQEEQQLSTAELREPFVEESAVSLVEAAAPIRPVELADETTFDSKGRATGVVIRPCVSRGARIRNLPPIYTPSMLGEHAVVFTGWPMFIDHAPRAVREALERIGEEQIKRTVREAAVNDGLTRIATRLAEAGGRRGVRDLGGQVLRPWYAPEYALDEDAEFGYQQGAVLAEYWATPYIREMANENSHLFHTSISAWPTAGKPATAPWNSALKGMAIEGIRRKPEGSWDFVVRGGAGGHLKAGDEEGFDADAEALMVSVAESVYGSRVVQVDLSKTKPSDLRKTLTEDFPQLAEELGITAEEAAPAPAGGKGGRSQETPPVGALSEEDVKRLIAEANSDSPEPLTAEQVAETVEEKAAELLSEREAQRDLVTEAHSLIENAEGLGSKWKADLKAYYALREDGPTARIAQVQEAAAEGDGDELKALRENVDAAITHCRELIAEATGKPRVKNEGGDAAERVRERRSKDEVPLWRERAAEMGLAESADAAVDTIIRDREPTREEATA